MSDVNFKELSQGVIEGDQVSVARVISMIEDRDGEYRKILKDIYPHSGQSRVLGITGPPGAGKSTLVNALIPTYADSSDQTGVIAVDPSSPYSGGSVLGDRIRFSDHDNVFFRSMSARGTSGGLAVATNDAVRVLEAAGYDPIIVETVGAGQSEVDIVSTADTVIIVLMPSSGDDIQMLKAGILEIAEIFVVNKMDLKKADQTVLDLKEMIHIQEDDRLDGDDGGVEWDVPVIKTEARDNRNIEELRESIDQHATFLSSSGNLRRKKIDRSKNEIRRILRHEINQLIDRELEKQGGIESLARKIIDGTTDPYSLAEELVEILHAQK